MSIKAVQYTQYGDTDVLKFVEIPKPVPGPKEVLIRVKATGNVIVFPFKRYVSRYSPSLVSFSQPSIQLMSSSAEDTSKLGPVSSQLFRAGTLLGLWKKLAVSLTLRFACCYFYFSKL